MRIIFARCLRGPASTALSGIIAGLVTQSATATSWIILGFVRAGIVPPGPALGAPTWANVGTAMLPLLVAIDTKIAAGIVIGFVGFATYFKLARTEKMRHALQAALGAALVLFGMQLVSASVAPVRSAFLADSSMIASLHSTWMLIAIGAGSSLLTQSSSVAAAIAVAAVGAGLLGLGAALPLVAAANAVGMINNLLQMRGENEAGKLIFLLQVAQKGAGSLVLVLVAVEPSLLAPLSHLGSGTQIALLFAVAQFIGAFIAILLTQPLRLFLQRVAPPSEGETLAEPRFLLREVLKDPSAALDLAMRELVRLAARLPLLLEPIRIDHASGSAHLPTETLRVAGRTLASAIRAYLGALQDQRPTRRDVAIATLLDDAAGNAAELHDALAELAAIAPRAASISTTDHLIESLHAILTVVAEHAETPDADDPDLVLALLGHRDNLMEELRTRLAADLPPQAQDALLRMTIVFERALWLARRLVVELSQARRGLAAA
jgi:phosphate:Na+ symporter